MRMIIIMMLLALGLQADRIVVPLVSKHNSSTDYDGTKFNEFNYGIGYEKTLYDGDNVGIRGNIMALNDSYKNPMYSATVGLDYIATDWLRVGMDFGFASKEIPYYMDGVPNFRREVLPILFIPTVTLKHNRWSISATHIPTITIFNRNIIGVTLLMIGFEL